MSDIGQSVRDLAGLGSPGRKRYRDLWAEEVASRIEEDKAQIENLSSTIKTANGAMQLAMQQMANMSKQHEVLTQKFAQLEKQLKALPQPETNGEDSAEVEVKGE